jgi:hypothetical protein
MALAAAATHAQSGLPSASLPQTEIQACTRASSTSALHLLASLRPPSPCW